MTTVPNIDIDSVTRNTGSPVADLHGRIRQLEYERAMNERDTELGAALRVLMAERNELTAEYQDLAERMTGLSARRQTVSAELERVNAHIAELIGVKP